MQNVIELKQSKRKPIQWVTGTFVVVFHLMAIWALFTFSWQNLAAAVITWWIAGSWGIGMGYHRLLTHGGYKTPKWMEYFLTVCATLGLQSGSLQWVTTHRIHHAFTETDKDPHSPREGTFWAHMGWILQGTAQNQPEEVVRRYAPDLLKDKFHVFVSKYYYLTFVFVGIGLYFIGGWSMVLWGIFLRQVLGWHSTWLVNSATHLWGTRRFETHDDSRNNGLIAAVTFGEGWHNNHHANPRSAKHGLAWYEFDPNWLQIKFLEKIGLAENVYAYNLEKQMDEAKPLRKAA
ncbi:MAG: fatty acid desaturase [Acidobacteria bacterium]|nr:fatty acid desaturase [Acidobacteriota bacterium]MCA1637991.1 fatty acid desaturase [Acidobacteriota bacterium]